MLRKSLAVLLVAFMAQGARAAYLIEIDTDGADDGVLTYSPDFSFGGDTTTASQSAAGTAYGLTGGDSIFGGDGVNEPDTYVYTYTPSTGSDNLVIPASQDLGDGNMASGLVGGAAGTYRVYATWPTSSNISGGMTTYEVVSAADSLSIQVDQNALGNVWVALGDINYEGTGDIVVTQASGTNSFVSMRAAAVMYELVPEPASLGLLLIGGLAVLRRRS